MGSVGILLVLLGLAALALAQSPQEVVEQYVRNHAKDVYRQPNGTLRFPYLVPAGPYDQLWDWDAMFLGVALLPYGSGEYLLGSMSNFFDHVDLRTGEVRGCLTPSGGSETIYHAKPVLIQGAWLGARAMGAQRVMELKRFQPQMQALLEYWQRPPRRHNATGLFRWHDQLETGADNLVTSECPSKYSPCWNETAMAFTLSSTDLMTFLYRELTAYNLFLKAWAGDSGATADDRVRFLRLSEQALRDAEDVKAAMNKWLWSDARGGYVAYNVSTNRIITNRVFLMAFPVFGRLASAAQARRSLAEMLKPDMMSAFGVRSTSKDDPLFNNEDIIVPYSNWQGPIWINANAALAYGFNSYGYRNVSLDIATRVVNMLAADLRATGKWHEAYHTETGRGLAAPGFLSWNTLGATLLPNIQAGVDPFLLS